MSLTRPGAVHVDQVLTNVSVAYLNSQTPLSTQIFKRLPVQKQSDAYRIYPKSTFSRAKAKVRAPGTETAGIDMQFGLGNYYARTWGLHTDIDDDTRANADDEFALDSDGVKLITQGLIATREINFASRFLQPGVWGRDFTPSVKWNDGGDVIGDVTREIEAFTIRNGVRPNVAVAGLRVHTAIKNNAQIVERIKYTQDGSVTTAMIMNLFDLTGNYIVADQAVAPDVANILPPAVIGNWGTPDDGDLMQICPDMFALFYVPPAPGLMTMAPGYTFNWTKRVAGGANDVSTYNFRMPEIKSDRLEAEMSYDQREVCLALGTMFSSVLK